MRRRRFEFFLKLLSPLKEPVRIIDIGGTEQFWEQMGLAGTESVEITAVNLTPFEPRYPNVHSVIGNGCDLRELFQDNQFDVVFSNSVIEHVPNLAGQQKMAAEMMRLAPRYFVQTPNYYFPLEPHFLVLGFQWMPEALQVYLLMHFNLGWAGKHSDRQTAVNTARSVKLLRRRELSGLFPGCQIYCEKALGLNKSFVAYGGWDLTAAQ